MLALIAGWLLTLVPTGLTPTIFAQDANQIALVVMHGDGTVVTRCVAFSEPELNGYEILQRSQLALNSDVSSMGIAVCSLDGEGCIAPQEDCFCGMNRTPPAYWTYWQLQENAWQYSNLGASNVLVQPGSVQGWQWGKGDQNNAAPPADYSFAQICTPATATPPATFTPLPTPTFTPTATDTPTDTPTPTPTPTFTPSYTPLPTVTPTWTPSVTPTFTQTPAPSLTPENAALSNQPNAGLDYSLRLPVVQAPAPTAVVAALAPQLPTSLPSAMLAPTPTSTPIPTETLLPTPTPTRETIATSTVELPTPLPSATPVPTLLPTELPLSTPTRETVILSPAELPTALSDVPTVMVTVIAHAPEATAVIVVTAAEVATVPTRLPTVTTTIPMQEAQIITLLGMLIGAGIVIVMGVGLVLTVGIAYWIGRQL